MNAIHPFDVLWQDLEMWGRWGRQDCCRPDPEAGSGSIYEMGLSRDPDTVEEAPEDRTTAIDNFRCEELDRRIIKLAHRHRERIRGYFYKRYYLPKAAVSESVRMLMDMEAA